MHGIVVEGMHGTGWHRSQLDRCESAKHHTFAAREAEAFRREAKDHGGACDVVQNGATEATEVCS